MVLPDADAMKRFLDGDGARPALVFLDADDSGRHGARRERGPDDDDAFLRPDEVEVEADDAEALPETPRAAPRTPAAQRSPQPLPARAPAREIAVPSVAVASGSVEDDGVVGQCVPADRPATAAGTVRRRPQAGKPGSSTSSSSGGNGVAVRPPSAVNALAAAVAAVALAVLGISLTLDTGVWRLLTQVLGVNLR